MFWENFEAICHDRGTNPSRVLKELNVSPSKLTLWKGGSLPKQEMLVTLANKLGCSVMDFFSDDLVIHTPPDPEDEDEADILKIYRLMPREEKHKFMARLYAYYEELKK